MTSAQDSSVLFALNELHDHEQRRAQERSAKMRRQADVARRQADEAARQRAEAETNAEELVGLRRYHGEEVAHRARLEAEVSEALGRQRLLEARLRANSLAPSLQPPPVRTSERHHLLWGTALLASCLAVFVLSHSSSTDAPPLQAAAVVFPQADCPEVMEPAATKSPGVAMAPPTTTLATELTIVEEERPSRRRRRSRPTRATAPEVITIEEDCDGPLCGLPER